MLLFHNARIFNGTEQLLPGHSMLVKHGVIQSIAPDSELAGSQAQQRVDCDGATILPGLVDCHVHLCFQGAMGDPRAHLARQCEAETTMSALRHARMTLEGGVTAVRDCGGRAHVEFAVRDAIAAGSFAGPLIQAAGRMICMTGGHGNWLGRVADGPDEVIKAVREEIHAGCDLIKLMATGGVMTPGVNPEDAHYSPEEMKAGVSEAHRFHRRTASHAQGTAGILNAVRAGIDSVEHGIYMTEETVREMLEAGTFLVPTLAAVRNILANADQGVPAYAVEKSRRVEEFHSRSIQMFYQAGGRIAMGTDAGTPFNRHGENAVELAYMVDIGMKPLDAVLASTRNGAELMGLEDRGELKEGKVADLLIVNGNPLEKIEFVADRKHHHSVWREGHAIQLQ